MRDIALATRKALLHEERLTWEHCQALAPRLAKGDAQECYLQGYSPQQALATGALHGAHAAVRSHTATPVGAWGYTPHGTIWSLWANDLSRHEAQEVLQGTPEWVNRLLIESGRPKLWNFAHADNKPALKWIRHSGCFCVDPDPVKVSFGEYFYFETQVSHETRV